MTFILSKLLWLLVMPSHLVLFALIWGSWRLARSGGRHGKGLIYGTIMALMIIWLLPIGQLLLQPLENRFSRPHPMPEHVDGIIVLGGAQEPLIAHIHDVLALNEASERLIEGTGLKLRYPDAKLLFSGHSANMIDNGTSEADVNKAFLQVMRIDPADVMIEDRSRNTFENARYSKELAGPKADEKWLLVTSAIHMPRSMGIFNKLNWQVIPYPVDFVTTGPRLLNDRLWLGYRLTEIDKAAREWLGLTAYYAMGRTDRWFPGPGG